MSAPPRARRRIAVLGASGFVGGELLRILLRHPAVEVTQVTSERLRGKPLHAAHPHLRGESELRYRSLEELEPADAIVSALAHGELARRIAFVDERAPLVVDCAADFRLEDPDEYAAVYGGPHAAPDHLAHFTYGLPEVFGGRLRETRHASGVGCNATAVNLALAPLVAAGVLDTTRGIVADLKVGSSEAGASGNDGSHHPLRSQCARPFAPTGHRHTAEVRQALGLQDVHLSVTAVDMVRGVLAVCHAWTRERLDDRDLRAVYREWTGTRPFGRVLHDRQGPMRHPDPKFVVGTNRFDLGWSLEPDSDRIVALAAIDNLGKGAAGNAVQCLNLLLQLDERTGLDAISPYPV